MKILKFFTDTCMTCRMLSKILDKIDVEVKSINAEDDLQKVDEYGLCTTPTLVFLDDEGKEVNRITGPTSQNKIEEILKIDIV